ncbi:MAG: RNase adapter RapZ [Rhodospirillaceae bacterium]|nr:RNase adapter RapZ [Rhodospirillaceae bacterium]
MAEPEIGEDQNRRQLVLITGLAGAGRSTALKALEDEGYEAIDNLPLHLVEPMLADAETAALAIAVDVRSRSFDADEFLAVTQHLHDQPALAVTLVFLSSDADALQRRFTETRRPHPLAGDGTLIDGIEAERGLMRHVMERSDLVIDTTLMSSAELRRHLGQHLRIDPTPRLAVFVVSFSYRHGIPRNADIVFDVRFLTNPYYDDDLREKTGKEADVARVIEKDPRFPPFFDRFGGLVSDLIPAYADEGKRYLTVAIGCTGGRHRSVFVAERLTALLSEGGRRVGLQHRELPS